MWPTPEYIAAELAYRAGILPDDEHERLAENRFPDADEAAQAAERVE